MDNMKLLPLIFMFAVSGLTLSKAGTQLSSSVILFYGEEFEPHGSSRCTSILQEAAKHGSKRVSIVPTLYFVDQSTEGTPGACNPDNWRLNVKVDYYCHYPTYNSACEPLNSAAISQFQSGFQACLQDAFNLGFSEVLITPHLDNGTKKNHWRNMLLFDPLQADSNGNSYWSIMLQPLLQAATIVVFPNTSASNSSSSMASTQSPKTIWLSLGGEMGGTLWTAPASYQQIIVNVKSAWAAAAQQAAQQAGGAATVAGGAAGANLLVGVLLSAGNVVGR